MAAVGKMLEGYVESGRRGYSIQTTQQCRLQLRFTQWEWTGVRGGEIKIIGKTLLGPGPGGRGKKPNYSKWGSLESEER